MFRTTGVIIFVGFCCVYRYSIIISGEINNNFVILHTYRYLDLF